MPWPNPVPFESNDEIYWLKNVDVTSKVIVVKGWDKTQSISNDIIKGNKEPWSTVLQPDVTIQHSTLNIIQVQPDATIKHSTSNIIQVQLDDTIKHSTSNFTQVQDVQVMQVQEMENVQYQMSFKVKDFINSKEKHLKNLTPLKLKKNDTKYYKGFII